MTLVSKIENFRLNARVRSLLRENRKLQRTLDELYADRLQEDRLLVAAMPVTTRQARLKLL